MNAEPEDPTGNAGTIAWIEEAIDILHSGRISLGREHLRNLVTFLNRQPPRFPTGRSDHVRPSRNTA